MLKGDAEVGGAFGDSDPVDVVEIGAASLAMGSFTPVKVLGCLSMIDDGKLDWKVIRSPPSRAAHAWDAECMRIGRDEARWPRWSTWLIL